MYSVSRVLGLACVLAIAGRPEPARAQLRSFEVRYTPAARVQMAMWVETAGGDFMGTVRLTEAVARRGIGNRPGALQMNSGFRWPYGRREGVLPIWAHRRAAAPGAAQFRRVIFQDRTSEGAASQTNYTDHSPDFYFCLSFMLGNEDNLDAVSCPTQFNSDKGRFITADDIDAGYGEPWQVAPTDQGMRALAFTSLYPPRRDVITTVPNDHPDASGFRDEALRVMPDIDAITMATAAANQAQLVQFDVPVTWPDGSYVLYVEVSTEKDHNAAFSEAARPTPGPVHSPNPAPDEYDVWAASFGFAYRGQPAVVYALPFTLSAAGGTFVTSSPIGYAEVDGADGDVRPIDATITDDPVGAPGSGADRLRAIDGMPRLRLTMQETAVCSSPSPPPECDIACVDDDACPAGFLCGDAGTCVGVCEAQVAPSTPGQFEARTHADAKHAHEWATLAFSASTSRRPVVRYDVRVSRAEITNEAEFLAAVNAKAATRELQAVSVCEASGTDIVCPEPGADVAIDIGWLDRLSTYHVAVRAYDACGAAGPIASDVVETTDIDFTTVSPCFVATAAYGSPMAADVQVLRAFRDAHLVTNAPGRALVRAYYAVGPYLAAFIRGHGGRRAVARALLSPAVALARALDPTSDTE